MPMRWLSSVLLALSLLPAMAAAQPVSVLARAEALQPPVWLERDGRKSALAPGAPLQAGDRFLTGSGGRLQISFDDNSVVKLGEQAQFEMPALQLQPSAADSNGALKAVFKVIRGAFRFTTSALGKLRQREIDVAIGPTVTAGIRGTDIWGKSDEARDLLCLLEGRVEVSSPGQPVLMMDRANTSYIVPQGQTPLPLVPEPEEQIARYVPQTELVMAQAALLAEGAYQIALDSYATLKEAQAQQARLSDQGYASEIVSASVKGKTWQRLLISGLASKTEALAYAARMKEQFGFGSPWVLPLTP